MTLARQPNSGNNGSAYSSPSGECEEMSVRQTLLTAATVSIAAFAIPPASAQSLRYANQGDLKSLDPYTLKETTHTAHPPHAYQALAPRHNALTTVTALA